MPDLHAGVILLSLGSLVWSELAWGRVRTEAVDASGCDAMFCVSPLPIFPPPPFQADANSCLGCLRVNKYLHQTIDSTFSTKRE